MAITVEICSDISTIAAADWDGCGDAGDPFTRHRFLAALERSGSVGEGTGWHPAHLVAREAGRVVGVVPSYLKTDSHGEYIFDWAWAEAYARAGGAYYPKLQAAVPFTPVGGSRLRAGSADLRAALLEAMAAIAEQNGFSGAHMTFCTQSERDEAESAGWLARSSLQYHWFNRGYRDYADFLDALASRKRKDLRKERARAQAFGGTIRSLRGADITPRHWDAMWAFYQDTGARKWGRPYLTRAFFDLAAQELAQDCLMVVAEDADGRPVAGALNLIGEDALYGRYWGCVEDHAFLHFELCYHRAIDWALQHGLSRVEAGAQGDHKLARGYEPVETASAHYLVDDGFRDAVAGYLAQERAGIRAEIAALAEATPFRRAPD